MLTWTDYAKILISVMIILDPPAVIPMFLSATSDQTALQRRRTARTTAITVAVVLLVVALTGGAMLELLGIRIATFRIAGGILVLLMAVSMLNAQVSPTIQTPEEAREAELKRDVAVVPLAIPLLAGPGAISTIVIYSLRADSWTHTAILCAIILFAASVTWITLRLSTAIEPLIGKTGLNVMTRLMGLLLAAVAIEFIVNGMLEVFPALRGPTTP